MSYATLSRQVRDTALADRVNAAVQQEAHENPNVADTDYAVKVRGVMYGAGDPSCGPSASPPKPSTPVPSPGGTRTREATSPSSRDGMILSRGAGQLA